MEGGKNTPRHVWDSQPGGASGATSHARSGEVSHYCDTVAAAHSQLRAVASSTSRCPRIILGMKAIIC